MKKDKEPKFTSSEIRQSPTSKGWRAKSDKVLILGKGFMGERLAEALKVPVSGSRINTFSDAERLLEETKPDILINGIGYTGKTNVDGCELEPDKTLLANTFVPVILAESCLRRGIKFIHISSGCIYHYDYKKDKPLTETQVPDFFELFYSRTKIYAERALEVLAKRYGVLILRIRIPLDNRPHPRNILTKLLSFQKVITLANSVTYVPDFIDALKHLIKTDAHGLYNVVNEGGLKYPDLLDIYKKHVPDFKYEVLDHKKLGLVRTNLLMSSKKLARAGFRMRPIGKVLEECVKDYLKY